MKQARNTNMLRFHYKKTCYALPTMGQCNCLPVFVFFTNKMYSLPWVVNEADVKRNTLWPYKNNETMILKINFY